MSRGVNKVIIIGNLGNDPEVNHMPSGAAVTNISVATSESWKDKNTGEKVEKTEWHRIVFFGRLAEIAGEYLKKGSKVFVDGRLQTDKYQGQDGQDRYSTKIVGKELQMLDTRNQSPGTGSAPPAAKSPDKSADKANGHQPQQNGSNPPQSEFDDDIPF